MTTRRKITDQIIASLEPIYGEREAKSIARIVVETLFEWSKTDFLFNADTLISITAEQQRRLAEVVDELKAARPVQYVLGECEFCGVKLKVKEGVLIPRPETEELVCWIGEQHGIQPNARHSTLHSKQHDAQHDKQHDPLHRAVSILDIGTGSGAIAIALSRILKTDGEISAIDVSDEAITIARENARLNRSEIRFSKIDILSPPAEWLEQTYDIIVSNPPYVPLSDRRMMHDNVLNYEPHLALFVDDKDPLLFYNTIAHHAKRMLHNGGWLYFEIYEHLGEELCTMLHTMGYTEVELRSDMNDKPRMIRCQKSFQ